MQYEDPYVRDRLLAALADDDVMDALTHGLMLDAKRIRERYYRFLPRLAANLAAVLAAPGRSLVHNWIMSSKFEEHMKEWEDAQ